MSSAQAQFFEKGDNLNYDTSNFYALPPGARFKAKILNIQPGKITIRLDQGGSYTCRTLVLPDARIGEDSYFMVKSNNLEGLIELEMLKSPPEVRQDNMVKEALMSAGMYSGEENIALGRALVDRNLPVDAFTMRALNTALEPSMHIAEQLNGLVESVMNLPAADSKQELLRILESSKLFMSEPKPLKQFYADLQYSLYQLRKQLKSTNIEESRKVFQEVEERLAILGESLKLMNQVHQQFKYYQIPFQKKRGELFIYDNNNSIIALDTDNLGRIEVKTLKNEKRIQLQFNANTKEILELIKLKSPGLINVLQKKGFQITGISYQQQSKGRTTVLTPSPVQETKPDNRRYAFDMRV